MYYITISHQYRIYRFALVQLETVKERERWKVIGGNGVLILTNNRPVLRRQGLKHRQPDWKHEGKGLWNRQFEELIIEAIEKYVEEEKSTDTS